MIVRELLTRLGFQVDGGRLREYQRGADNIRQSADRAADSFRNIFLGFAGFGALRGIIKTADDLQGLEARIGQLPQTITSAAEGFDVVSDRASAARQSIEAYGSFYVKLQQAGKDFIKTQEEGLQVTDTISKALIVGGATAAEQSSALLQFGQAIGSGVLQGEELRALSEAAPQFLDSLANAIGIPRAELKKFASEGKLTSKAVIEAVKSISTEFNDRFSALPITIGQATTIIGNRWGTFINRLNRESSAVTKTANFFLGAFDSIELGLKDLVDFFGGSTNTLKFFGIALAAAIAPLALQLAAGAVVFLLSPLGLLIGVLLLAGLAIEDFYQWMTGGDSAFGDFFGNFADARKEIEKVISKFSVFKNAVIDAFNSPVVGKFFAAVKTLFNFLTSITDFETWFDAVSTIFNGLADVFFGVISIIIGAFKALLGLFTGDFELLWEGIKQIFSGIGDVLLGVVGVVWGAIKLLIVDLIFLFKLAFGTIGTIISDGIYGSIVGAAKKGWAFIKSLFGFGVGVDANVGAANTGVTPATVAGAASSASGVPTVNNGGATSFVVHQTLPPGSPQETQDAARAGIDKAFNSLPMDRLARQMGQVQ